MVLFPPMVVQAHVESDGYSSSEGQHLFCEGTKSLYSDSNKFALTSDWIQSFLQTRKAVEASMGGILV
jgi:hypothetical protein